MEQLTRWLVLPHTLLDLLFPMPIKIIKHNYNWIFPHDDGKCCLIQLLIRNISLWNWQNSIIQEYSRYIGRYCVRASSISLLKNYFLHAKCDQIGTRPFKHYIIDVHFAAILSFPFFRWICGCAHKVSHDQWLCWHKKISLMWEC